MCVVCVYAHVCDACVCVCVWRTCGLIPVCTVYVVGVCEQLPQSLFLHSDPADTHKEWGGIARTNNQSGAAIPLMSRP